MSRQAADTLLLLFEELWRRKAICLTFLFSSFRREVDQCFGSVWTGKDVLRRHCTHLCGLPPSHLNPHQSIDTSETPKRRVALVREWLIADYTPPLVYFHYCCLAWMSQYKKTWLWYKSLLILLILEMRCHHKILNNIVLMILFRRKLK